MSTSIRVLLTDDHAVVRSGVRRLLEQYDGIEVVAEAESGEQAYQLFGECLPDVLVMDMSMPGMGGLESLRRILARYQDAKVIIFSMHENATFATQALTSGAVGYVAKSGDADDLVNAVLDVASGKNYLSADMAQKIALQSLSGDDNPTHKLTAREFEVFRFLAEGKVVDEIAKLLNIGQKTVANYQTLLKQKLGVNSPVELVRLAIKCGVIEG
ncbi:MAG: response regulator transcription factor [Gammaproteobacteria bacterium]|nr:response regulator transcription factor [Gammaproteobacteria bacterium]